jgi:drug/metabolite transporter (DMT)-like permease
MIPKSLSKTRKTPQFIPGDLSWADGLLLLTVFFWGVNFSVVKFALAELPPLIFNGLRFLFAASLMMVLAWTTGHRLKFQRRHLFYLIGLGLLNSTIYQLLFIFGIANTTADNSALILATVPVWVALFGTLASMERVTGRGWLGVMLSLGGIVLIILGSDREVALQFGEATLRGDILILLATLCWSLYTLVVRPMLRHYSSTSIVTFATLIGAIPLVLLSVPLMLDFNLGGVSTKAWGALIFSGTFGIALAYFFWNYGVAKLGSARTSLYSNLTPPIALLAAWLWLGEALTPQQWWGGLLVFGGVVLARRYTSVLNK